MSSTLTPTAGRLVALLVGLMILGGCALVPADSRLAALPATIADGLTGRTLAPPATAAPTLGPTGESDVAGLRLRRGRRKGAFRMDLYRRGDHVRQFTSSWCVGASMQM